MEAARRAMRDARHFGLQSRVAVLEAEVERLRRDCAELYQVIGVLADYAPKASERAITKALDNASAAANGLPRPHDDLLPFYGSPFNAPDIDE